MLKILFFMAALLGVAAGALAQGGAMVPVVYTDGGSNADVFRTILSDGQRAVTLGHTRRYPASQNRQRLGVFISRFDSASGLESGQVFFDSPDNDEARDLVVVAGDTMALVSSDGYSDSQYEARIFRWSAGQTILTADTVEADLWAGVAYHDTLIVVGHTVSQFDEDALIGRLFPGDSVMRFDTLGWLPGQQRLFDVALLGDSLGIAVGSTDAPSATGSGIWVVAFDPITLDTIWTRKVLAGNAAAAYGVANSSYGDIYVVGRANLGANNYDIVACRYDYQGQPAPNTPVSWGSTQGNDALEAIVVDDTTICAVGSWATSNHTDVYLVELDLDLSIRCDTAFGSNAASESAYAVAVGSPGGSFQVAGTILPGALNVVPAQADGFAAWFGCDLQPQVSAGIETPAPDLSVYPNPVIPNGIVRIEGVNRPTNWVLYSAQGQKCAWGTTQSGGDIQVPAQSRGLYILRLDDGRNTKIIVR